MAQDVLADGFVKLCIDTSLNFADNKCRVLVEGQMGVSTCGVEADTLVQVPSTRDIDCMFGAGSVIAETLKKMFCQCPANAEFYAIPREDPAAATAAEYTVTFTGNATSDGRMDFYLLDGDYSIDFGVITGDTPTIIGDKFVDELPDNFPYTAVNALGVVTLTAKAGVLGEVGNYLIAQYSWLGRRNYNPEGVTVAFEQTVIAAGDLTAVDYASIIGTCCYTCFAHLSGSAVAQAALQAYLETLWDCKTPQCFGHGYTYVPGSLGQILARDTNANTLNKMAHCIGDVANPWFKVGAYTALSCCTACTNPELSIQGRNYGVLSCLRVPESCTACFTFDEQQQLKDGGFVVTGPFSGGQGEFTSPYVFNDITNNRFDELGRPNSTFRDTNSRRLAQNTAVAIATKLQEYAALALFTRNTTIRQGIFGTNPRLMLADIRAWAKSQVGILFSEFDNIDADITLVTDFQVAPACQGDPNKLHLNMVYRPPVRVGNINVNLQPKLLDNCVR